MPYKVVKTEVGYKLYKIKEGIYAHGIFKTKQSAINQAKNWMRYRNEKPYVKGDYILSGNDK